MATNRKEDIPILVRLRDLERQSEQQHRHIESFFLNEEELAIAQTEFKEGTYIRYDGGYENALKKKLSFLLMKRIAFLISYAFRLILIKDFAR